MSRRHGAYELPDASVWTKTESLFAKRTARGSLNPRTPLRTQRMVERAILLHQNDDVLGVEVSGAGCGFDSVGAPDRFGNQAGDADGAGSA